MVSISGCHGCGMRVAEGFEESLAVKFAVLFRNLDERQLLLEAEGGRWVTAGSSWLPGLPGSVRRQWAAVSKNLIGQFPEATKLPTIHRRVERRTLIGGTPGPPARAWRPALKRDRLSGPQLVARRIRRFGWSAS